MMAWVCILRGPSDRHYIGSAVDLDSRFGATPTGTHVHNETPG